jgi:hypothetical protein
MYYFPGFMYTGACVSIFVIMCVWVCARRLRLLRGYRNACAGA